MATEEQKQQVKELSDSYIHMMSTYAAKDLMEFLGRLEVDVLKSADNCPMDQLTSASFGRVRGVREAIQKIRKHIDFSIGGNFTVK